MQQYYLIAPTTAKRFPAMGQAARWDAEQDPGFLIADVARLLRAAFERQISETGLTRTQWQALVYLIRQEGLTQTELAQRLDIGKATVGGVIDRLARAGLVERRDDPIDRRANRVYVTDAARRLVPLTCSKAAELYDEVFGDLPPRQREHMLAALQRVRSKLLDVPG
ncbi:MAG: transcriptional regulator [Gammaproteobacteria bacterium]|nr:transcriptional regulator [Gammaproteobacteria bacterium]|tara:strand:- start:320 stop:820 length:501 start_codon:yes stop_codon:yes gene_type:complete